MASLCRSLVLTSVAGLIALVAIPSALAKRSGIEASSKRLPVHALKSGTALHTLASGGTSVAVGSAVKTINTDLHDQQLAIQRNTHYLQQRDQLGAKLLQLGQKTPSDPREARMIQQAIARNTAALGQVNRLIALSVQHLNLGLASRQARVNTLAGRLAGIARPNSRLAAYVLSAMQQQQSAMVQLQTVVNKEEASPVGF